MNIAGKLTSISGIKLTSQIDFEIQDDTLRVTINDPSGNVQDDKAAFESWIVAIMAKNNEEQEVMLDNKKQKVLLDIKKVILNLGPDKIDLGNPHFRCFMWRAYNFSKIYPDWFQIGNFSGQVQDFMNTNFIDAVLNQPTKKRETPEKSNKEPYIEWLFTNQYKSELCQLIGCNKIVNQFPVGIFIGKKSNKTALFPDKKRAIDIIGIEYPDILHFIELKYEDKPIGIISEFLLYAYTLREKFITKTIRFDDKIKVSEYKDFESFEAKAIKGHLLAQDYHPLITPDVIELLNEGLKPFGISIDRLRYERPDPDKDLRTN